MVAINSKLCNNSHIKCAKTRAKNREAIMSNHIKAKILGLTYGAISQENFAKKIPDIADSLRSRFPNRTEQRIQDINIDMAADEVSTTISSPAKECLVVDAKGKWGVTIGNQGIKLSVDGYAEYDETLEYFKWVLKVLSPILNVLHFSQVSLRNINLFAEVEGQPNRFADIQERKHWGRQEIEYLTTDFTCSGAATKHIYYSSDYLNQIQLSSGIVMEGQSYIPRTEWAVWSLRGKIPSVPMRHLMIDITATSYQAPVNEPSMQIIMSEYSWADVALEFEKLHTLVNGTYFDIVEK